MFAIPFLSLKHEEHKAEIEKLLSSGKCTGENIDHQHSLFRPQLNLCGEKGNLMEKSTQSVNKEISFPIISLIRFRKGTNEREREEKTFLITLLTRAVFAEWIYEMNLKFALTK